MPANLGPEPMREPPSATFLAGLIGAATVSIGLLVIVGWMFNLQPLLSILPGSATMKPNTALGFILVGLSLLLSVEIKMPASGFRRFAASVCSGLVILVGTATWVEYVWGFDLGIDQWIFPGSDRPGIALPGRMSIMTVNQHGKLTRDPGKSALKSCHPGDVQSSGAFAGATWGDTYGIHRRNQTASFCGW